MQDGQPVGGVVIRIDGTCGDLDLLFVSPKTHSKGIGYAAWCAVEQVDEQFSDGMFRFEKKMGIINQDSIR